MADEEFQKNVLGEKLETCSVDPVTGWFRDGCCNTNETDLGVHTVCAKVTTKFLEWAKIAGNDLITPHPEFNFPGLKEGDSWCVCAATYAQSIDEGTACKVYLKKTNQRTLEIIPLTKLKQYAMILGTAGFTSLLCAFAIKAREELLLGEKVNDVLVTGATGGVGSIAVMVLSKFGYNVTAVTGKRDKVDFLKKLGAKNIIDRKELEGEPRVLGKGSWDGVVDTVGGVVLSNAISQTRHSGIVAACGNAANINLNTTVMPFIIRGVKLWGIDSVMVSKKRREFIWSQAINLIDFKLLEKNTIMVSLEELLNIFPKMLKGEIYGRVVVDLSK